MLGLQVNHSKGKKEEKKHAKEFFIEVSHVFFSLVDSIDQSNCAVVRLHFFSSSCSFENKETMGDRYNIHSQLEHLQSKYIGK